MGNAKSKDLMTPVRLTKSRHSTNKITNRDVYSCINNLSDIK